MTQTLQPILIEKSIGPSFEAELRQAGLDHIPLSFSANTVLITSNISQSDLTTLQALINAHDSSATDPFLYRELRATAYPALSDQLDEIMKWVATQTDVTLPSSLTAIAAECMNVKQTYPKP